MKLEKFQEKKPKQKGIIIGSIVLFILITVIVVYRSFALFEEKQEFDVIKGSVPNQNYDLMLSFQVEDENGNQTLSNTIPSDHNYEVSIICNNGASGLWNAEEWAPMIQNLTKTRTKCTLLFTKKYKESILNGMDPVLKEGLIPVTIENDGSVKKANEQEEWYDYETQKWANAVILEDESIKYQNGETIPESNIESYFVWIPKYRYKLWDLGNYEGLTSINSSKVHDIEIIFGEYDTVDKEGECRIPGVSGLSGNCKEGDYMTHPAFQSFGTKGIWVGKFEVGYKGATSTAGAQQNIQDRDKVEIKPNVYSWRSINVSNAHLNSYNYKREYDSHMMKNTEWGAVAYLQHSIYGSRASVRINNNSNFITGYSALNEPTCGYTADNRDCNRHEGTDLNVDGTYTKRYNSEVGYLASTTNNISGIYDISGGAWEYTMGVMTNQNGQPCAGMNSSYTSGFTGPFCNGSGNATGTSFPDQKYYDTYQYGTKDYHFARGILGDATGEFGPFGKATYGTQERQNNSWYIDSAWFVNSEWPWFFRGCARYDGLNAGMFAFGRTDGDAGPNGGYRIVLAFS